MVITAKINVEGTGAAILRKRCMKSQYFRVGSEPTCNLVLNNAHIPVGAVTCAFSVNNEGAAAVSCDGNMEKIDQLHPGIAFAQPVKVEYSCGADEALTQFFEEAGF